MRIKSYVGTRFGRLVALERIVKKEKNRAVTYYLCKCDCGNIKEIRYANLYGGRKEGKRTYSCGCYKKEILHARKMPDELIRLHAIGRYYRRNASVAGRKWRIKTKDFEKLVSSPCYYCSFDKTLIGLDRVDSSKDYTLDNVVPCCKNCNLAKNNMSITAFADWVQRIHAQCKKGWCPNV